MPNTRTRSCAILLAALAMTSEMVQAQGLASHVHGNAELNVVSIGQQVQMEFISPAINLLGFERAPITAEEAALLNGVSTQLEDGDWLTGDALSNCRQTTQAFAAPMYDEQPHDHDEEHDHTSPDTGLEAHHNFRVQYLYDCPAAPPRRLRITAFEHYRGIESITVQWIAGQQQGFAQLSASNPELTLE